MTDRKHRCAGQASNNKTQYQCPDGGIFQKQPDNICPGCGGKQRTYQKRLSIITKQRTVFDDVAVAHESAQLRHIGTKKLVDELSNREDVRSFTTEPDVKYCIEDETGIYAQDMGAVRILVIKE